MRTPLILLALVLSAASLPAAAHAQGDPPRPELPRDADPNDWQAYFDEGSRRFDHMPERAGDYFYWASRVDPTRAEPLVARWAAFYARDQELWIRYLEGDPATWRDPRVRENETLLTRAFRRNPFVHRGLEAALFFRLGDLLRWGEASTAFVHYGRGNFGQAAQSFGRLVRANPQRNYQFRQWRAMSFVGAGQYDSAAAEIEQLLVALRADDEREMTYYYESKSLQEYGLGMLHQARGQLAEARRAFERALEEDLAMYPARAALGRLSLGEGKPEEAVEHLTQAVEIAPNDGVMHFELGNALLHADRLEDAAAAYQRATELEPHFADAYLWLGMALDNAGNSEKAAEAYRAYLQRAPRRQAGGIQRATERLAALTQGG